MGSSLYRRSSSNKIFSPSEKEHVLGKKYYRSIFYISTVEYGMSLSQLKVLSRNRFLLGSYLLEENSVSAIFQEYHF